MKEMLLPSTTDDAIFDNIGPGDLVRYSRTCKAAREAVSSYNRRAFNLERVLSRYFTPTQITKLRELQFETGALISGSTALQLLDRSHYENSDLDLYVTHHSCKPIGLWLQSIGYQYEPKSTGRAPLALRKLETALEYVDPLERLKEHLLEGRKDHSFLDRSASGYLRVLNIYDFKKPNDNNVKIQLMTTWHTPLECVLNFHSTCVMNFITYDKAFSLYPQGTFNERRSLAYLPTIQGRKEVYEKYTDRGWKIVKNGWWRECDDPNSAFAIGLRRVGDAHCWTVPLSPKLDLPESTMEGNTWCLDGNIETETPEMVFRFFKSPILSTRYLVGTRELEEGISSCFPERTSGLKWDKYFKELIESFPL
ncbi:unnamed protein product [Cyclocybe aegerita]|uniref:Uncharacterized protein n=1 Tax=Cyclocybe aegerita TaxID=1973307 RepID=A0A8S0X595_CYCAE|nr:unnamed protein product [Cyclocybe aegerita]